MSVLSVTLQCFECKCTANRQNNYNFSLDTNMLIHISAKFHLSSISIKDLFKFSSTLR